MPVGVSTSIAAAILETHVLSPGHCACASAHASPSPLRAPAPPLAPGLLLAREEQVGAEHVAPPLKGAGRVTPRLRGLGGRRRPERLGRGRAGRRRRERAEWQCSKGLPLVALPGKPPATLPQLGRWLLPPPRPRPAALAPPRLADGFSSEERRGRGEGGHPASCCRNSGPHTGGSQILTGFRARPEMQPPCGRPEAGRAGAQALFSFLSPIRDMLRIRWRDELPECPPLGQTEQAFASPAFTCLPEVGGGRRLRSLGDASPFCPKYQIRPRMAFG